MFRHTDSYGVIPLHELKGNGVSHVFEHPWITVRQSTAPLGTQKHSLPTTQQCQPDAFMYLVAFVVIVILSSTHVPPSSWNGSVNSL